MDFRLQIWGINSLNHPLFINFFGRNYMISKFFILHIRKEKNKFKMHLNIYKHLYKIWILDL